MVQLVSLFSQVLHKKRDRTQINYEHESSLKRQVIDPDVPLTSGVRRWDVGVVEESMNRELERKWEEVAWYLDGEMVAIPTGEGGVSYVGELAFKIIGMRCTIGIKSSSNKIQMNYRLWII